MRAAAVLAVVGVVVALLWRELGDGDIDVLGGVAVPAADPAAAGAAATPEPPPLPEWMRPFAAGEAPPQFVLFSFDGAASHAKWERILPLAERVDARITALLSGIYLVPDAERTRYTGPGHAPGGSSIGFGGTPEEVTTLVADLNRAKADGHEIGTHYNGHFCAGAEPAAGDWLGQDWDAELAQFFRFVEEAPGLEVAPADIKGSRTPCLEGIPTELYPSLARNGLTWDSSRTSGGVVWPYLEGGIWQFPIPSVRVPATGSQTLMLDYNFWVNFNGGRDDPSQAPRFAEMILETYLSVHDATAAGNRAPIEVANHFNEWSGGGFNQAMFAFMEQVCVRPGTVCATHVEVLEWMALQDPAYLASWTGRPASFN